MLANSITLSLHDLWKHKKHRTQIFSEWFAWNFELIIISIATPQQQWMLMVRMGSHGSLLLLLLKGWQFVKFIRLWMQSSLHSLEVKGGRIVHFWCGFFQFFCRGVCQLWTIEQTQTIPYRVHRLIVTWFTSFQVGILYAKFLYSWEFKRLMALNFLLIDLVGMGFFLLPNGQKGLECAT